MNLSNKRIYRQLFIKNSLPSCVISSFFIQMISVFLGKYQHSSWLSWKGKKVYRVILQMSRATQKVENTMRVYQYEQFVFLVPCPKIIDSLISTISIWSHYEGQRQVNYNKWKSISSQISVHLTDIILAKSNNQKHYLVRQFQEKSP